MNCTSDTNKGTHKHRIDGQYVFFVKTNGACVCPSPPLLLPHSGYRLTNSKFSNFKITVVRA